MIKSFINNQKVAIVLESAEEKKLVWSDGYQVSDYAVSVRRRYLAEESKRLENLIDERKNSVRNAILELEV